ncbi:MAG: hypothetical protein HY900_36375 [Deltaproteobacteria bacterium]|nr:hypothetical protein [Deltaproteobacteria bacterium]
MKNANRNILLAATAALALVVAPSALADLRLSVNLPKPPSPREVLSHLPAPPLVQFADRNHGQRNDGRDRGYDDRDRRNDGRRNHGNRYNRNRNDRGHYDRYRSDGRWNYPNRHRDDRYSSYRLDRYRRGHYRRPDLRVWVGSRWMMSPYAGGVWIDGRWLAPPFPGAVWVDGYYDEYGDWIVGGWVRPW